MRHFASLRYRLLAASVATFALASCAGGDASRTASAPVAPFVRNEPKEVQELFSYREDRPPAISGAMNGTPTRTVLRHARALFRAHGYTVADYDEDRVELITTYQPAEPGLYRIAHGKQPQDVNYRLELVHSRYVSEPIYTITIRFESHDAPNAQIISTGARELSLMNELRNEFGLAALPLPRTNLPERGAVAGGAMNWDDLDSLRAVTHRLDSALAR